ncbi:MAG TPA: DUF5916 domain-containing protein [Gemmatimonadaceae bacterium]|nr:DUF5916 domain-containing protein [Gemmatimonadaceae bacterium]
MRPNLVCTLASVAVFVASVSAQQPASTAGSDVKPRARAVRASQAPAIDGKGDDAVWKTAQAYGDFVEFQPTEGKTPRYKTEFKAAYDDRNLYFFIRAFDPHPDSIMSALTRRDVRGSADQLKVMIDSYNDRRSGFEFAVSPSGVKRDYAMYNDSQEDQTWDGIWDVGTQIDSLGWTAEFKIPFSQLRYGNSKDHTFGLGIWRDIERYKERSSWPLYHTNTGGISSQIAYLDGITDIAPFRRLEIVPFVSTQNASIARPTSSSAPGSINWGRDQKQSAGADLKYGITPNLTLDATVNPDFGQVEADPSVLNLSAFETFFQERRPFFIEGSGFYSFDQNCSIVNCSGENLFYSRRIGRAPQLAGLYADETSNTNTRILGAAKLTGRLGGGLNVGAMEAITGRVTGTDDRTTEPRAGYTVLRAQQDLRNGELSIGAIGTGVVRSLDEWTDQYLRKNAFAGGLNFRNRWGKSRYELAGSVTASDVTGTRSAITRTQTSSVHLYQRPDDDLAFDTTKTSLTGHAEEISFGKSGGNMIHYQTSYQRQSAGYELNDLGFLRRANQQNFNNWMGINWIKPTKYYRRFSGNFNAWGYWTADGLQLERAVNTNWHLNTTNNMFLNLGSTIYQLGKTFCDNCARGGPALRVSPGANINASVSGDDRRMIIPSAYISYNRGDAGRSNSFSTGPDIIIKALSQLQLNVFADWSKNKNDDQWIGNFKDAAGNTHYTFAHLDQETSSIGVRADYTATPTLSLQIYAAPFVSRGKYSKTRELSSNPGASEYDDRYQAYSAPASASESFDVKQLRSNSVLRWEFRPGSTLFAVWTHGRDGFDSKVDRSWPTEYRNLFDLHPTNTFLLKVAYWFGT